MDGWKQKEPGTHTHSLKWVGGKGSEAKRRKITRSLWRSDVMLRRVCVVVLPHDIEWGMAWVGLSPSKAAHGMI